MPNATFDALALNSKLQKALNQLGFTQATEVQALVIPPALEGKDLLVNAATGSGKSAAFLLPVLERLINNKGADYGCRALILAPTRELAKQLLSDCEKLARFCGIKACVISGGQEFKYQQAQLRKDPEIIIATPGRILEHLQKGRGTPDVSQLEVLVLDEADRMFDMGMAEDVASILEFCSPQRQNLLLSATLPIKIKQLAADMLKQPQSIYLNKRHEQSGQITQQIIYSDDEKYKSLATAALLEKNQPHKAIVFTNTIVQAQKLSAWLNYKGFSCDVLHGDMTQDERVRTTANFRNGKFNTLVATDLAARGLDIKNLELVINFDMARKGDDYIHRIGRTGRAGASGLAISLIAAHEYQLMSSIERYLNTRFERIILPGLSARYTGPKKVKSSGKAAGTKKPKNKTGAKKANAAAKKKPRKPSIKTRLEEPKESGFKPLRRRP